MNVASKRLVSLCVTPLPPLKRKKKGGGDFGTFLPDKTKNKVDRITRQVKNLNAQCNFSNFKQMYNILGQKISRHSFKTIHNWLAA